MAAAAAILGIGTLAFLVLLFRGAFSTVSDFSQFIAPAKMLVRGEGSQLYVIPKLLAAEQALYPYPARGVVVLFAPPCGLPWLLPLALLPAKIAPDIWKIFLVLCLGTGVYALKRAFKLNFTATCWLVALVCLSGVTYDALRIDQMSTPMFLGFCLAVWALKSKRPYIAGLALTIFLLKPQQIAPFLILLAGARQYKSLASFGGVAALFTIIAFALIGVDGFHNYSNLVAACSEDNTYMVPFIICTLRGQLYRIFQYDHHALINVITGIICFLSYIWFFVIARRLSQSKEHWLDYGLIAILPMGVALSPYCMAYDLLPLICPLLVLMTEFEATLPPATILIGMILTMVFIIPFSVYIHQTFVLSTTAFNPQFAVLFIWSVACMVLYYKKLQKTVTSDSAQPS